MRVSSTREAGSLAHPFVESHQLTLAEAFVEAEFSTPRGVRGLQFHKGEYWRWWNGRWEVTPERVIENMVLEWSRDRYVQTANADNSVIKKERINTWGGFLSNVMRGVKATSECSAVSTPVWLRADGSEPSVDTKGCIAFEDVVVDCAESAKQGKLIVYPRDERYFGSVVLPCKFDPEAKCERWMKALEEWGEGEEKWGKLLQREFGYVLMPFRGHRKFFLHFGIAQGGKSLIQRVKRKLLGERGQFSTSMIQLAGRFGLHPLKYAQELVVTEVRDMDGKGQTEQISAVIKSTIGQDEQWFDEKNVKDIQCVISPAAVVMLANKIPEMSDANRGLSSKLVMLPFHLTFEGRSDPGLYEKFMGELQGIAAWAVRGAIEVMALGEEKCWEPLEGAKAELEEFSEKNNSADEFMRWGFKKNGQGFVDNRLMWELYQKYCVEVGVSTMGQKAFGKWVERNNSWGARRGRRSGGSRGFYGIALKPQTGLAEIEEFKKRVVEEEEGTLIGPEDYEGGI